MRAMLSRSAVCLTLLLAACSNSPTAVRQWRIELASSGGIAGRGAGTVDISSSGAVSVTATNGRQCSFTATDEEIRRIGSLLAVAGTRSWRASYVPADPCCDRFQWTLTVEADGSTVTTTWVDDPLPMPADLTAVVDALSNDPASLRNTYGRRCAEQ
jgi:hypothetical protein